MARGGLEVTAVIVCGNNWSHPTTFFEFFVDFIFIEMKVAAVWLAGYWHDDKLICLPGYPVAEYAKCQIWLSKTMINRIKKN